MRITTPKYSDQPTDITTNVVSGTVEKVEVSHLLRMTWTGIEGKVILIQADNDIVVYGLNKEKFSTDGFLAYPTDVIGYEYYTISHSPTNSNTEFAVAAKYDDTEISLRLPARSRLDIPIRVEFEGKTYTNGDWLNTTLQAFEAFQCVSYDRADLTATYILSNKPIAAFSGNIRTWVGESDSRDHLAIQLPPVGAYGKQFPVIPIPGRTVGDVINVIAPIAGTQIKVANTKFTFEETEIDGHKRFVIPSNNYTTISADQPILVVQVSQSQMEASEPGDPTMLVVTATSQFAADYVFSTPKYHDGGETVVDTLYTKLNSFVSKTGKFWDRLLILNSIFKIHAIHIASMDKQWLLLTMCSQIIRSPRSQNFLQRKIFIFIAVAFIRELLLFNCLSKWIY